MTKWLPNFSFYLSETKIEQLVPVVIRQMCKAAEIAGTSCVLFHVWIGFSIGIKRLFFFLPVLQLLPGWFLQAGLAQLQVFYRCVTTWGVKVEDIRIVFAFVFAFLLGLTSRENVRKHFRKRDSCGFSCMCFSF